MKLNNRYNEVFGRIPILGMIHHTGDEPVKRALEELAIYEEEGVDGVIVENYYNRSMAVIEQTLQEIAKLDTKVVIGVNILPNEFDQAFPLAVKYGADFIQLDYVAGKYEQAGDRTKSQELNINSYSSFKEKFPDIIVLGGVWPKYFYPIHGSNLDSDLETGLERAEAIVVTGEGTGMATPMKKIKYFREKIGDRPLVVGAGLEVDNAYDKLCIANGAIVGTTFKVNGYTPNQVDKVRVKDFMDIVKQARKYQETL